MMYLLPGADPESALFKDMDHKLNTDSIRSKGRRGNERRRYDSALRQAQAQRTRQVVLEAGRSLIIERGYARTTMRETAARAGVAVETVYQHFRSKPELLKTLLDDALGGEGLVPVAQREWVRQVLAQPDATSKIALAAEKITAVHTQLAALFLAVRAAAEADPKAAEIWAARKAERLRGMSEFARHLIDAGALRPGITIEQARDILYTLISPEIYGLLVLELNWPPPRYTAWLTDILTQQLLPG